ncbi:hypothetical protein [Vibrio comitans]|uniref:Uncharacterized protein n=1 Tax=Vibrio comitans NBRC 102076 TaxID=1219078 RepID=A0A4Y3IR40_9VIBR|nr:hypothetical protein [Vibrio comitans]GEA61230.1 hypothetical protein VCO01S_24230 [Vibrio comitans NBRC 102076]
MPNTSAERAIELGAPSLSHIATRWGCTTQDLEYLFKVYPERFEMLVSGVLTYDELDAKKASHKQAHDLEFEVKSLLFEIIESARLDSMCEARNLSEIASARVEELSRIAKS